MSVSSRQHWAALHEQSTVVDLHAHPALQVALFRYSLTHRFGAAASVFWPHSMRTSFLKLQTGGIDVLLSVVYIPEAPILKDIPLLAILRYSRPRVWRQLIQPSYFQATLHSLDEMETEVAHHNAALLPGGRPVQIPANSAGLAQLVDQGSSGPIAIVHCIEGSHSLQGEFSGKIGGETAVEDQAAVAQELLANLEVLARRGVAYLTLAHFYPNRIVHPTFPFPENLLTLTRRQQVLAEHDLTKGLTKVGEMVVERMLDLGLLIDVSHCTPPARARVYQIVESRRAQSAVIATHVGAYALNPSPYNLEDWEIRWIADHGGVIGVIFMNYWLMPSETRLGMNAISQTLAHFIQAGGTENVAGFGSDFDGFTDPPDEMVEASQVGKLTERLVAEASGPGQRRYADATVAKIIGGNALRVLLAGWGPRL